MLDTVTRSLDQVEFEAKDPVARFHQEYQAKASKSPDANHRVKLMAAAPVGMFLGSSACSSWPNYTPAGSTIPRTCRAA